MEIQMQSRFLLFIGFLDSRLHGNDLLAVMLA